MACPPFLAPLNSRPPVEEVEIDVESTGFRVESAWKTLRTGAEPRETPQQGLDSRDLGPGLSGLPGSTVSVRPVYAERAARGS